MNNGLISSLLYMYLLCSGGQRPWCPWNYSENTRNFIPFPYTHWQHACCLIRVIPCILCKCREICIYQKVLITISTNNNNLLLFMNNGLIIVLHVSSLFRWSTTLAQNTSVWTSRNRWSFTVKPLLRDPLLNSHPLWSGHQSNSCSLFSIIYCEIFDLCWAVTLPLVPEVIFLLSNSW